MDTDIRSEAKEKIQFSSRSAGNEIRWKSPHEKDKNMFQETLNSIANPFKKSNWVFMFTSCSFNAIKTCNLNVQQTKMCNKFLSLHCVSKYVEVEVERRKILTLFINILIVCHFFNHFFCSLMMKIWNFFADNHQCRFHQTLLHFIYENYIFLIGLFQFFFISCFQPSILWLNKKRF